MGPPRATEGRSPKRGCRVWDPGCGAEPHVNMCGIAGFVSPDGIDHDAGVRAVRMRDILTHRGPDESGLHLDTHAVLAHRRLSIVGLFDGRQPISNEDGSVSVVYNGELFDYPEVRADLESRGHCFRTHCDTELLPHLS